VLELIKKWLKAPVYEDSQFKGGKKNKVGTPQGGVISPLLANVYLNLLDRIVENPKSEFWKYGLKMGLTRGRRGADPLLSTLLIQKITF
jgi:RNA-directed DNA polymerase